MNETQLFDGGLAGGDLDHSFCASCILQGVIDSPDSSWVLWVVIFAMNIAVEPIINVNEIECGQSIARSLIITWQEKGRE